MTSRERLLAVLHHEMPDCGPVCPDISNMVPGRLTGKPFWDVYAYQNPPLWKAHLNALNYLDIDGGFEICSHNPVDPVDGIILVTGEQRVVKRFKDGSFATQRYYPETGQWGRLYFIHRRSMRPRYAGR